MSLMLFKGIYYKLVLPFNLLCLIYVIPLTRLSFALSASKIKEKARVVALDLRGHGKSVTDNDLDLSIEVAN